MLGAEAPRGVSSRLPPGSLLTKGGDCAGTGALASVCVLAKLQTTSPNRAQYLAAVGT